MSRAAGLVAAAVLILLTGCSDDAPTPAATSTAPVPEASSAAPATPSAPPATTTPGSTATAPVPGAECLNGTWRLVRFLGRGEQASEGTGRGGDMTVAFDDGGYTLVGKGEEPITVNLAGESASLRIDGTVKGSYAPAGAKMAFTIDDATGEGTLQSGNQRQTLPLSSVAQVVAPNGEATLACREDLLVIDLPAVRLELQR